MQLYVRGHCERKQRPGLVLGGSATQMRWARVLGCRLIVVSALVALACEEDRPCSNHYECDSGEVCSPEFVCRPTDCNSDSQCGTGRICSSYFLCVEGCRFQEDCPSGQRCDRSSGTEFAMCRPGCTSDSECAITEVCALGTCQAGCRSSYDCPPGTFCLSTPSALPHCAPGCHDDGECDISQYCSEGACRPGCESHVDCSQEESCVALDVFGVVRLSPFSYTDGGIDWGSPFPCGPGERCICATGRPIGDAGVDAWGGRDAGRDAT